MRLDWSDESDNLKLLDSESNEMERLSELVCKNLFLSESEADRDFLCGEGQIQVRQKGVLGDDISNMERRHYSDFSKKTE